MMLPLFGLAFGILIGFIIPFNIPAIYSSYMSIAVLAALDSVFGGIRANLENNFDSNVFISGFFGNAILAAFLAYIGDRLGIPLYYAAIFAFGTRLFQNFAIIRRYFIKKIEKK